MIEVCNLIKRYGTVTAVDDVSFSIQRGEVFGLLGPNGAGKSTIIRMLTTLTTPDSGSCSVNGFDSVTDRISIRRLIGVVPQENNLDRELTAQQNLTVYCKLHKVADMNTAIMTALAGVDLTSRKDSDVNGFSGGMKRRLLIARALLNAPAAIFLDEPSIGLDPQIRHQLWDIIRKSRIEGRTVIMTTHYIEEAEALCDRVGILAKGRLIALGTTAELRETVGQYVVEHINSEGKLVQQITQTREQAHEIGRAFENGVTIRKTNLEDVFIKLTGERIE